MKISSALQKQAAVAYHFKHGEAPSRNGKPATVEYRAWRAMIDRCYLVGHAVYKNHGARGIKVCDKWRHDYLAFLADMGRKPFPELTLERMDNDGDYTPTNCKWASRTEQAHNKRAYGTCGG